MIIAFEGIDGSGKTTVIEALSEYIEDCQVTGFPGECLREWLKVIPKSVHYLWYLDEMSKYKDFLTRRDTIIVDRWYWSTIAYQGVSFECSLNRVELMDVVFDGPFDIVEPDIIFYLKVDGDVAEARRKQRGERDAYDRSSRPFFNAVEDTYEWLAKQPLGSKVVVIDANQALDSVIADVIAAYKEVLGE